MTDLIPPDMDHCQCEITEPHRPFIMGGECRPRPRQCGEMPAWLVVEIVPGADGLHGSMTLCNNCAKVMLDRADLRARVQLQPILRKATA